MTTLETMQLIGTELEHSFAGLVVRVVVEDVKVSYGKRRLLVRVAGQQHSGRVWIER